MTTYSTSDLSRKSGDIIAEALRRPVTITQRNKPRLVVLNIEDYRGLTERAETRKVGTLETMPDALFEEIQAELARSLSLESGDGPGRDGGPQGSSDRCRHSAAPAER